MSTLRVCAVMTAGCLAFAACGGSGPGDRGAARWYLVISMVSDGDVDLYAVDSNGGPLAAVTHSAADDELLFVTADGRLGVEHDDGAWLVTPSDGREKKLGYEAVLAPDRRTIAVTRLYGGGESGRIELLEPGKPRRPLGSGHVDTLLPGALIYQHYGETTYEFRIRDLRTGRSAALDIPGGDSGRVSESKRWLVGWDYDQLYPQRGFVWLLDAQTPHARARLLPLRRVADVHWLPGERLGVTYGVNYEHHRVFDLRGKPLSPVRSPHGQCTWSPDGRQIVCGTGKSIEIVDMTSGARRALRGRNPVWSHDGRAVAAQIGDKVSILDVASGKVEPLAPATGLESQSVWRPDDRALAWTDKSGIHIATRGVPSVEVIPATGFVSGLTWVRGALPAGLKPA